MHAARVPFGMGVKVMEAMMKTPEVMMKTLEARIMEVVQASTWSAEAGIIREGIRAAIPRDNGNAER
jgi:hypothetical protein